MVLPVIRSDEDPHVSVRLQRARPIGTSFADTILASGHVPHRKAGHTTARRGGSSSQNCLAKSGAFTHEHMTAPDHIAAIKLSSCATAAVHTWVHAERLVHKIEAFTAAARAAKEKVRCLIWWLYADLKAYRTEPSPRRKGELKARFDRIFKHKTGFATLDRLLTRLHANKAELLRVLDRPEIPLHTNGAENDIRCQVIRRKVSGTTRSDAGRDCRDTFLSLAKTCKKLGIPFWHYLGARLGATAAELVPSLPELVTARCSA